MKKLLIAIFGEENAEKPVNKAIAYAVIGTAAALVLTVLILIISSIAFALNNGDDADLPADDGESSGGGTIQTTAKIEYDSITAGDLDAKLGDAISVQSSRTSIDGGIYYAAHADDKLVKSAQSALDKMLVDFYNNNKSKLVIDTNNKDCNVPYAHESDGKYTITIDTIDDKTTFNVDLYQWIYTNAYKYGFVYDGNTFTYVGVAASNYMKNNNMTYTAFLSKIKSSTTNLTVKASSTSYEMYYLAANATDLKVPKSNSYTVIAVGTDGYIITVNTSKTNG